jgi:23S rRNA (cytosine1962-C5)-methyltransferase
MNSITLRSGREKSVLQGHPWIFSGGVVTVEGAPEMGETVAVRSAKGEFLAWAAYSAQSQIRARVWTTQEHEIVNEEFLRRRVEKALALRRLVVGAGETTAMRLIHGESDGLPGVVVDRYADTLVMQILSAGAERWREELAQILVELTGAQRIYERSDVDVRTLEGLPERVGALRGEMPEERVLIEENGLKFTVDVLHGQKTGFYVDQRRNRNRLGQMAAGRDVLNCFCYTGGFSAYALANGAKSVLSVDSSKEALAQAEENLRLNGLAGDAVSWLEADVFTALRTFRDQARSFDLIVLDPPKFAPSAAQAEKAARGYKDINLLAFKLLRPGGVLFTFSCSGGVSADLFQKIVAGAALDAHADAVILEHLEQGADHPVALNFPEGTYLKGLVCLKR